MTGNLANRMPFSKHLGIKILQVTADRVTGEIVVDPSFCTTRHIMHGGAIMAFADSLGAISASLALPEGVNGTTTIESKTNFLGAAKEGTTVRGETRPVKVGARVSVWQTEVTNEEGKPVALVTQTQLVL